MGSWVYVFSKFTPEALLFEALVISLLAAGYAAFWVLRKRKYGVLNDAIPTGVVKGYLNELIVDAEQLRAQLFGLMGADARSLDPSLLAARMANLPAQGADPGMMRQLTTLETRMAEQARAMEAVLQEKAVIEKQLADARAAGAAAAVPAAAVDKSALNELENKVKNLESKLAEYSVIEDDLANLKRLQQENAQLRAALANQGGAPLPEAAKPAPAAEPAITAAAAVAAVTEPEPVVTAPEPAVAAPEPAAATAEPALPGGPLSQDSIDSVFAAMDTAKPAEAPAPAAAAAPAAENDKLFEGLVDQVEQSLKPEEAAPVAAEAVATATPVPSTASPAAGTLDKSDADLVAEFEKMLNG